MSHLGSIIGQILTGSGISNLSERVYAKVYAMQVSDVYHCGGDPTFDSKPEEMNHFEGFEKDLKK